LVELEARKRLSRGRVELVFRLEGQATMPDASGARLAGPDALEARPLSALALNRERARAAYRALVDLSRELGAGAEVPFSMLSALPDLFVPVLEVEHEAISRAVVTALGAALDDLDHMREREGQAMAKELERRLRAALELIERIGTRAPEMLEAQAQKFRERLARIQVLVAPRRQVPSPGGPLPVTPIDAARLEQELVLLAERSDVSEELTRLRIHGDRFLAYLSPGAEGARQDQSVHAEGVRAERMERSEPVGRRLDFLLQEMAREINTIGAKSQDFGIAHLVVELKAEIEKMRELVQNVE
jgi:uncharacterized protein YicC (UPF0701 family)